MPYDIIPLAIIIVSLGGIASIVYKKLPKLSNIDIDSIQEVKENEAKLSLMEERVKRKLEDLSHKALGKNLKPVVAALTETLSKGYRKILELQKEYVKLKRKEEVLNGSKKEAREKVGELLKEAKDLFEKAAFKEAEEKFIEIVSLDAKNLEAYRGLGELYLKNKDYGHAEATFEHILKLAQLHQNIKTDDYINIGISKRETGKHGEAKHYFANALEIEGQNPKILDLYIEMCIASKDKSGAWEAYAKLREVNPENQKLEEFRKRIMEL